MGIACSNGEEIAQKENGMTLIRRSKVNDAMMRLILGQSAILRNPLGLADAFGLDLGPNFIALELPRLDLLESPEMMCKEALVVGCTCREDEMFFPVTSRQPASWFVGRKLCDFVNTVNGPPFPVSAQFRPLSILQIEFQEVGCKTCSDTQGSNGFLLQEFITSSGELLPFQGRMNLFIDEHGRPKWILTSCEKILGTVALGSTSTSSTEDGMGLFPDLDDILTLADPAESTDWSGMGGGLMDF